MAEATNPLHITSDSFAKVSSSKSNTFIKSNIIFLSLPSYLPIQTTLHLEGYQKQPTHPQLQLQPALCVSVLSRRSVFKVPVHTVDS